MNLWIYGAGQDRERKKVTRTCTTRYVTLVSVVLALALTAACGSDEPSGGTGPDRTASTPTETPASPTRTPSTPVPSPTATDAPGTAAATAPPAVSGSAETDREALVALYNATNGENWFESDNWLSDAPIGEWYGVIINDDGRFIALVLDANNLSGCVPSSLEDQLNFDASYLGDLPFCGTGSAETDREALVALYNATNGENWFRSDNWLSDAPPGEWYGVVTNDDGRVIALVLSTNNLSGEISAELGSLSHLKELVLDANNLSGEIPAELSSLSNLQSLSLHSNGLSGEIPAELGSLSNLVVLFLHSNNLSGEIPAELGSLSNLEYLVLHSNELSGCVPSSLEDQLDSSYDFLGGLPFC